MIITPWHFINETAQKRREKRDISHAVVLRMTSHQLTSLEWCVNPFQFATLLRLISNALSFYQLDSCICPAKVLY
jgi:hypothetical protein